MGALCGNDKAEDVIRVHGRLYCANGVKDHIVSDLASLGKSCEAKGEEVLLQYGHQAFEANNYITTY